MAPSRLTFNEKCPEVCWQRQLRDSRSDPPPDVDLDLGRAVIRPISRKQAEHIILQYEWLGTMGPTSQHFGIFFGDYCGGVTCFELGSVGANVHAHSPFKIDRKHMAYLARGACVHWAPTGTNSKLVSWSSKLIGQQTGAKLVIAFADTDAGEVGTIYQACGWTYIGKSGTTRQFVSPHGRVYDQKLPHNMAKANGGTRGYWRDKLIADGWREQESNPKYRYVLVLDKSDRDLVARVKTMALPYPKRPAR